MIIRSINSLLQKSYCTQDFITKHNWHRKKNKNTSRIDAYSKFPYSNVGTLVRYDSLIGYVTSLK